MTTATGLIAEGASGLHRVDDLIAARAAAQERGWRVVELDTTRATDKPAFLDVCREAFALPDWFGHNWDALADSLTEVNDSHGTLVLWSGAGNLPAPVRETATEIFAARAARTGRGPGAFLVLVGDGNGTGRSMNDL